MDTTNLHWSSTFPPRDVRFDGCPEELSFVNSQQLKIQCYRWTPEKHGLGINLQTKGIVAILHGVRSHCRLGWLAKRPSGSSTDSVGKVIQGIVEGRTHSVSVSSSSDSGVETSGPISSWLRTDVTEVQTGSDLSGIVDSLAQTITEFSDMEPLVDNEECSNLYQRLCSENRAAVEKEILWTFHCSYQRATDDDKTRELFYDGSWVQAMVESGWIVVGMDTQGHGRSDGYKNVRCNVRLFQDYVDDLDQFLEIVRKTCTSPTAIGEIPLVLCAVSLSTIFAGLYLCEERSKRHNIESLFNFATIWCRYGIYASKALSAIFGALKIANNLMPQLGLSIPGVKPEEKSPPWQRPFAAYDPYLVQDPFFVNLIIQTVEGIDAMSSNIGTFVKNNAVKRIYFLHNFNDKVNAVESAMLPLSQLQQLISQSSVGTPMTARGIVFNVPENIPRNSNPHKIRQWSADTIRIFTSCDLAHTLITDWDNYKPFTYFLNWLEDDYAQFTYGENDSESLQPLFCTDVPISLSTC